MAASAEEPPEFVSITPLLTRLAYPAASTIQVSKADTVTLTSQVSAEEIASVFALIFENRISDIQMAAFLTLLHSTRKDRQPEVIAKCAERMREAAAQFDKPALKKVIRKRGKKQGNYRGGLVSTPALSACSEANEIGSAI